MLDFYTIFLLLLLGAFVGFAAGMFGIGGGGIMVPLLTSIFLSIGIANEKVVHIALGTSMCIIIMTTFSSFRAQHKKGFVHWDIWKMIAPGVLVGTFLGTFLASKIGSFYLAIIFSIFMFYVSIKMFFSNNPKTTNETIKPKLQFLAGCGIGSLSSLVSIGGGVLSVPYLMWQNIDIKKAIGTSSAIGFPLALSGTLGYIINGWSQTSLNELFLGYVYLPAVLCVGFTSYFFAPLGVKAVHKIPSQKMKKLFAILPFVLSIKMIYEVVQ